MDKALEVLRTTLLNLKSMRDAFPNAGTYDIWIQEVELAIAELEKEKRQ